MATKTDITHLLELPELQPALTLRSGFRITEVPHHETERPVVTAPPSLGPLHAFNGTFTGNGFNTIFRPNNSKTPTQLPAPVPVGDNILELNLTSETLSFSPSLGAVPNRGSGLAPGKAQADAFLNGVPYLQSITDITNPSQPTGIHLEPGLWMIVPSTTVPLEGPTLVRMASIPHGTTILAQGTFTEISGPPVIHAVDITPFVTGVTPKKLVSFPSQIAENSKTPRIPQNLGPFIAAGSITQPILSDPNTVLRNHLVGQKITKTSVLSISTTPGEPLFGGGAENIAFLLGDSAITIPNAQTVKMEATFWIETVEHTLVVPPFKPGQRPLTLRPEGANPKGPAPTFHVEPPFEIERERRIKVTSTQIQYSQQVCLNFAKLTWPHVSVATLVPSGHVTVPPSAWV